MGSPELHGRDSVVPVSSGSSSSSAVSVSGELSGVCGFRGSLRLSLCAFTLADVGFGACCATQRSKTEEWGVYAMHGLIVSRCEVGVLNPFVLFARFLAAW